MGKQKQGGHEQGGQRPNDQPPGGQRPPGDQRPPGLRPCGQGLPVGPERAKRDSFVLRTYVVGRMRVRSYILIDGQRYCQPSQRDVTTQT